MRSLSQHKLVAYDRGEWERLLEYVGDLDFEPDVARALLSKIDSVSYWADIAESMGANDRILDRFQQWVAIVSDGIYESPYEIPEE